MAKCWLPMWCEKDSTEQVALLLRPPTWFFAVRACCFKYEYVYEYPYVYEYLDVYEYAYERVYEYEYMHEYEYVPATMLAFQPYVNTPLRVYVFRRLYMYM
jgi:hypothetical protein